MKLILLLVRSARRKLASYGLCVTDDEAANGENKAEIGTNQTVSYAKHHVAAIDHNNQRICVFMLF